LLKGKTKGRKKGGGEKTTKKTRGGKGGKIR